MYIRRDQKKLALIRCPRATKWAGYIRMGIQLATKLPRQGRDPFQVIFINEEVIPFFARKSYWISDAFGFNERHTIANKYELSNA